MMKDKECYSMIMADQAIKQYFPVPDLEGVYPKLDYDKFLSSIQSAFKHSPSYTLAFLKDVIDGLRLTLEAASNDAASKNASKPVDQNKIHADLSFLEIMLNISRRVMNNPNPAIFASLFDDVITPLLTSGASALLKKEAQCALLLAELDRARALVTPLKAAVAMAETQKVLQAQEEEQRNRIA